MFSDFFNNKKCYIYGLALGGSKLAESFAKQNIDFYVWDDNQTVLKEVTSKLSIENKVVSIWESDFKNIDYFIPSPAIDLNLNKFEEILEKLQENKVQIISELDCLFLSNPVAKYIGITGTNGKSSTTSLIYHILQTNGFETDIGGNIGIAVSDLKNLTENGSYVLEISSFQLDISSRLSLDVALLLNITSDHLDRYKSMDSYIESKKQIFSLIKSNGHLIINYDNPITKQIAEDLHQKADCNFKIVPFSMKEKSQEGFYFSWHEKLIKDPGGNFSDVSGINFEVINPENFLASYILARIYGVGHDEIVKSVNQFSSLPHRMELVAKYNNLTFINDSKATNVDSTLKALENKENIYLILGGKAKGQNFDKILTFKSQIKAAYLVGEAQDQLYDELASELNCNLCGSLDNAFKMAIGKAALDENEAIILLSPACSSLDQWVNFEHRGNGFKKLVREFLDENEIINKN